MKVLIEIIYTDGTTETITIDEQDGWKVMDGLDDIDGVLSYRIV